MKHFLLTYTLAPDYLARRPGFRAEHLGLAQAAVAGGDLVLGGAVAGLDGSTPDEASFRASHENSTARTHATSASSRLSISN